MKRFYFGAALFLALVSGTCIAAQAPLTTLKEIHGLSTAEADKKIPVSAEGTVIYFRASQKTLILQDGNLGVYMKAAATAHLIPGDRVLVKGVTKGGFRPAVICDSVTLLGHHSPPKPVPATFEDLIRGKLDATLVKVRGVVRSANLDQPSAEHSQGATLHILTDGGMVDAELLNNDPDALSGLLDAQIELTAAAGERFDGKMQQTGVLLHISNLSDIKILKPALADPWTLPLTPMDQVLGANYVRDLTRRVRVSGVITYWEPGYALVLQNGPRSLWISTRSFEPMQIGDRAEATGFPTLTNGFLDLAASQVRDTGIQAPVSPQPVTWNNLSSSQHIFDLVSIDGIVAVAVREAAIDEYVLVSDGYEFSAFYRHPAGSGPASLPHMKEVATGSRIRVTGVCVVDSASPYGHTVHFNILLRSPDDIEVLAEPSWFNTRHMMMLTSLVLVLALLFGARGWFLEHRTRRQIGSLAYVEKRRGRILEDINSSEPLAGILERTTELVSVRLNGAPCWCQVADGPTLGNRPRQLNPAALRVVEHPIASRSGPSLGTIYAAFDARTRPTSVEREALSMAAELATLAIETSHLYSDLVRRSEFDMLTDVQNRFAMERTLNALIHDARQSAGIFGLIYIDLNDFKQVNDVHGHLVGDLYLQEIAQRMKHQLRPGDMLARLGGDEFALLIPSVRNRAEVEEIAARLESCFQKPFTGNGYVLHGSASIGIALYPEDAASADELLSTADAAMYVAKHTRPGRGRPRAAAQEEVLLPKDSA